VIDRRDIVLIIWESDAMPIGFSSADKIASGRQVHMHLHILCAEHRYIGYGVRCVPLTAKLLFDLLDLKRFFCEPNAFNVARNRTLQRAGFKHVKTHETVPGPFSYHQPVTRWVLEAAGL
jgi:RimJ/RimL family protein N-acetyltransferase